MSKTGEHDVWALLDVIRDSDEFEKRLKRYEDVRDKAEKQRAEAEELMREVRKLEQQNVNERDRLKAKQDELIAFQQRLETWKWDLKRRNEEYDKWKGDSEDKIKADLDAAAEKRANAEHLEEEAKSKEARWRDKLAEAQAKANALDDTKAKLRDLVG